MTADDLWNNYKKKYPSFADKKSKVTVSVETLENMVKSAFASGRDSNSSKGNSSAYEELFGNMFGGGPNKKK